MFLLILPRLLWHVWCERLRGCKILDINSCTVLDRYSSMLSSWLSRGPNPIGRRVPLFGHICLRLAKVSSHLTSVYLSSFVAIHQIIVLNASNKQRYQGMYARSRVRVRVRLLVYTCALWMTKWCHWSRDNVISIAHSVCASVRFCKPSYQNKYVFMCQRVYLWVRVKERKEERDREWDRVMNISSFVCIYYP